MWACKPASAAMRQPIRRVTRSASNGPSCLAEQPARSAPTGISITPMRRTSPSHFMTRGSATTPAALRLLGWPVRLSACVAVPHRCLQPDGRLAMIGSMSSDGAALLRRCEALGDFRLVLAAEVLSRRLDAALPAADSADPATLPEALRSPAEAAIAAGPAAMEAPLPPLVAIAAARSALIVAAATPAAHAHLEAALDGGGSPAAQAVRAGKFGSRSGCELGDTSSPSCASNRTAPGARSRCEATRRSAKSLRRSGGSRRQSRASSSDRYR